MDTNAITEAVRNRPFEPFTLRMNDGRWFYIPHPESAAVSKCQVVVFNPDSESFLILEPVRIASLEFGERKIKKGKNGKH